MATLHYAKNERVNSDLADGVVSRPHKYEVVLSNFPVGQAEPQPEHKLEFAKLIKEFTLGQDRATATVSLIEGYTDALDTEESNANLRFLRAMTVSGWLQGLISKSNPKYSGPEVVRGAPPGKYLNPHNDTEAARAANRAVKINLSPTLVPPPPPNPKRKVDPPDKSRLVKSEYNYYPTGRGVR